MNSLKTEKIQLNKQARVFITKTATKNLVSESLVEKVVSFQFKDLLRAFKTYESIEISGFGKFTLSQRKAKRLKKGIEIAIERMEAECLIETSEEKKAYMRQRLQTAREGLEFLEKRIKPNEVQDLGDHRGVEESHNPPGEAEGNN